MNNSKICIYKKCLINKKYLLWGVNWKLKFNKKKIKRRKYESLLPIVSFVQKNVFPIN